MTGSVALDVVIGLVFVYLLYSLLTTTITEIISSWIQLRATFLVKGVKRMLDDGSGNKIFSNKFFEQPLVKYLGSVNLIGRIKKPAYLSAQNFSKNLFETLQQVYLQPLNVKKKDVIDSIHKKLSGKKIKRVEKWVIKALKILDSKNLYPNSQIPYRSQILEALKNANLNDQDRTEIIDIITKAEVDLKSEEKELMGKPLDQKIRSVLENTDSNISGSETVRFIKGLLDESQNDLEKFKTHLEKWYDDTMERVTGWYKRRVQFITFYVGLGIAIAFNVDTISVVSILSKDPKARDQMMQLATAYVQDHQAPVNNQSNVPAKTDARYDSLLKAKIDSLMNVKSEIEKDISEANSILGLGWDLPDSIALYRKGDSMIKNSASALKVYAFGEERFIRLTPTLDRKSVLKLICVEEENFFSNLFPVFFKNQTKLSVIGVNQDCSKVYASEWKFFFLSFWGYVLTAIALSLGAPFWFDLLNKLVKLRSSVQVTSPSQSAPQGTPQIQSAGILKIHG